MSLSNVIIPFLDHYFQYVLCETKNYLCMLIFGINLPRLREMRAADILITDKRGWKQMSRLSSSPESFPLASVRVKKDSTSCHILMCVTSAKACMSLEHLVERWMLPLGAFGTRLSTHFLTSEVWCTFWWESVEWTMVEKTHSCRENNWIWFWKRGCLLFTQNKLMFISHKHFSSLMSSPGRTADDIIGQLGLL